jgi:hypothetical protein
MSAERTQALPIEASPPGLDHAQAQVIHHIIRDCVERGILGRQTDSFDVDKIAWLSAALTSSDYALAKMRGARRFASNYELLSFALSLAPDEGLFLEFGVFSGKTINHIARQRPQSTIYGFDSFEGLPENWRPGFPKGAFSMPRLPDVHGNVELVPGWFDRTLPEFCAKHRHAKAAFIHVDCDLYASTQTVLSALKQQIVPGTVMVFDEYFNYPEWQKHEAKALREFCESNMAHYEYVGLVPHHQQVAIRILG